MIYSIEHFFWIDKYNSADFTIVYVYIPAISE